MIVSHRHSFIFVAVPKTGTHAVRQALREQLGADDVEQVGLFVNKRVPWGDLAAIQHYLGVMAAPVFCTKIASKLTRTYTDRHGLKNIVSELLGKDISKQQQSSDWGAPELTEAQREYAASDVRYLHQLHTVFVQRLEREGRLAIAQACYDFLPARALLDLAGWPEHDIFSHE